MFLLGNVDFRGFVVTWYQMISNFDPSDFLKKTGLKHTKDLGDQIFGLVVCRSANTLSFHPYAS